MTKSEHITALFVGGWYYWFKGEDATASMCWRTAVDILGMTTQLVGEA
jgi:hypothetical protein